MARLHTAGGEFQDSNTVAAEASPDGRSAGVLATTPRVGEGRSGAAAIRCNGHATSTSFREWAIAPTAGTGIYVRAYERIPTLPAATKKMLRIGTAQVSVRLTSAGKFQLWNDAAGTQIGSDSTITVDAALYSWYRLQLYGKVGAGAVDEAELRVAGVLDLTSEAEEVVASTSGVSITDTNPTVVQAGWIDSSADASAFIYLDDIAINDSTGTKQNSWPNEGHVVLGTPVFGMASRNLSNWTSCSGSAAEDQAVRCTNNTPPNGNADHTTAGHAAADGTNDHLIHCASNTSVTDDLYIASYARMGIPGNVNFDPGSTSDAAVGDVAGREQRAQSFSMSATISYVELKLKKVGSPTDNVVVTLYISSDVLNAYGSIPETAGSSVSMPMSSLTTSNAWYRFTFPDEPLSKDVRYWIVVSRSGAVDGSNYFSWALGSTSLAAANWSSLYDGTNWTNADTDHALRCFASEGYSRLALIRPVLCHGEAVATGTKSGTLESTANPVIASTSFSYGDDAGAAGTYPTNWRWHKGNPVYDASITNMSAGPVLRIGKTDGTTRVAMVGFAGVLCEYSLPESGWVEYIKTSDSTHWWAKRANVTTEFYQPDDTSLVVRSGDYAIQPDPVSDANTMASIDDATLQANYTRA